MLKELGFVTAWHLTDIGNLESIAQHGLLSRADVSRKEISHIKVGWEGIVHTRPTVSQDYVLSFVKPQNEFVYGRRDNHHSLHKDAQGLCLLELDLESAIRENWHLALVSSGNLAKRKFPAQIGHLFQFEEILNLHVFLGEKFELNEMNANSLMAEVLLPSPVKVDSIRNIWVKDAESEKKILAVLSDAPVVVLPELFNRGFKFSSQAIENFSKRSPF